MAFTLSSSAFKANKQIPKRFSCEGDDISPPLAWSGAPKETQSYALVCTDPDAPGGVFHHWAIYDVPADATGLPEGYSAKTMSGAAREATNDFGRPGYGGPCPPRGHGSHHYHFQLHALKTPHLPAPPGAGCRDVIAAARQQTIATAELIGVYER